MNIREKEIVKIGLSLFTHEMELESSIPENSEILTNIKGLSGFVLSSDKDKYEYKILADENTLNKITSYKIFGNYIEFSIYLTIKNAKIELTVEQCLDKPISCDVSNIEQFQKLFKYISKLDFLINYD